MESVKARLVVVEGKPEGMEIPLKGPSFLIGRAKGCQLRPRSDQISRRHCAIEIGPETVSVRDLDSSTGTFVNDRRIHGQVALADGDLLRVGPLGFSIRIAVDRKAVADGGRDDGDIHETTEFFESNDGSLSEILSNFLMQEEPQEDAAGDPARSDTVTDLRASAGAPGDDTRTDLPVCGPGQATPQSSILPLELDTESDEPGSAVENNDVFL